MEQKKENNASFAFGRQNYILLCITIVILIVGFLLMVGGNSEDPDGFNPEIFSARRITIAPVVVIFGFIFGVYAIMKKDKKITH